MASNLNDGDVISVHNPEWPPLNVIGVIRMVQNGASSDLLMDLNRKINDGNNL